MPTYFAGSSFDAATPSLTGAYDFGSGLGFTRNGGGHADCYVVDPPTGTRIGVKYLWSHGVLDNLNQYGEYGTPMAWYNAAGQEVMRLSIVGYGTYQLSYWSGTAWLPAGDARFFLAGTIDVLAVINPTAGRLAWFVNGNLAADVRALDTSGMGDIARLQVRAATSGYSATHWSQLLLASYNTIGHTVTRRVPNEAGSSQGWVGGHEDIDDDGTDDSNAISASTVGDLSTFKAVPFPGTGAGNVIKSVVVAARIRNDGQVVPTNAKAVIVVGGQRYDAPADLPISAGFSGTHALFDRDPSTGLPWSDVSALNGEFGLLATE